MLSSVLVLCVLAQTSAQGDLDAAWAARYPVARDVLPLAKAFPLLAAVLTTDRVWTLSPEELRAKVLPEAVTLQQGSAEYPLLYGAQASPHWPGAAVWQYAAYEVEYYCFDVSRPAIKLHVGRPLNSLWHNRLIDPAAAKKKTPGQFPPLPDAAPRDIAGNLARIVDGLQPYGAARIPFAHPRIVKYRLPGGTRLTLSDFSGSLVGTVYVEILLEPAEPLTALARGRLPAFPGAEGYGSLTPGGRGGKVYVVTTLDDYLPHDRPARPEGRLGQPSVPPPGYDPQRWVPFVDAQGVRHEGLRQPRLPATAALPREAPLAGSLRQAIEAQGPRTILFAVSGTIALKAPLLIRHPYVTLVGNTAPGEGVQIRNWGLDVNTHDVILRYLRIRVGDIKGPGDTPREFGEQTHALNLCGMNLIVDHCEFAFANDQIVNFYGHERRVALSFQWNYVYGGLLASTHEKGAHSMSYGTDGWGYVSMHHNLTAHSRTRNPRIWGLHVDYRNNVLYNYVNSGYGNANDYLKLNYVGNVQKRGKATWGFRAEGPFAQFFAADNSLPEGSTAALRVAPETLLSEPWESMPVATDPPQRASADVLDHGGADLPVRDVVTRYVAQSTRDNTGEVPRTPADFPAGGFPHYTVTTSAEPRDADGIPIAWKKKYRLDPSVAQSNAAPGYTNLEMYLYGIDPTHRTDHR